MSEHVSVFLNAARCKGGPVDSQVVDLPDLGPGTPLMIAIRPGSAPRQAVLPVHVPAGEQWPRYLCLGSFSMKRGDPWPYTFVDEP